MSTFTYIIDIEQDNFNQVTSILRQMGYPTKLSKGEDISDWWYRTGHDLDDDTKKQLESIPGVKVTKMNEWH